jgi:hypothetical protein
VISKYFRETYVVLATRTRIQSPFEKPGRIQYPIHLCTGDWPDFFNEIVFGRITSGPPRWFAAYLDRIWVYSGFKESFEPTLPAAGTEGTEWHTVVRFRIQEESSGLPLGEAITDEGGERETCFQRPPFTRLLRASRSGIAIS